MSTSPDLGIPFVAAQQEQPEITHNEAIVMLQAMQVGVIQVGLNTPPGSPTDGDSYVIGPSPTGAWAGRANTVAYRTSGGWRFVPDRNSAGTIITMGARQEGMRVWDKTTNGMYIWDGSAWVGFASTPPVATEYGQRAITNNATTISVTAAADSTLNSNGDYIQIVGIWNATPDGENFGATQQTNTFTVATSGFYRIEVWLSCASSANNTQVAVKFGVNGSITLGRRPKVFLRNTGEVHGLSAFGYHHFDAGDVISLWIASTQTANIRVEDAVFGVTALRYD